MAVPFIRVVISIVIAIFSISQIACQSEILGITGFNICFNLDISARNATDPTQGALGTYLNCTNADNPSINIPVTVIDLRLTASNDVESEFVVDLAVIPDEPNRFRSNTNGLQCNADQNVPQNCQMMQETKIEILSTKYVFYYPLWYNPSILPQYCYMTYFNMYTQDNFKKPNYNDNINQGMADMCTEQTVVKNCLGSATDTTLCNQDIQQFGPIANISRGIFTGQWNSGNYWDFVDSAKENGRCRRTAVSYDAVRKYGITNFEFQSGLVTEDTSKTNLSMLISDPEPMDLQFSANRLYESVLQSITCTGVDCGIYNGICYNHQNPDVYPDKFGTGSDIKVVGIQFYLYQLRPICYLYDIKQVPSVAAEIEIRVTTIDSSSTGVGSQTETITISNLMGTERNSSEQRLISASIISVDTLDGYLGPSLNGYIMICGGQETNIPLWARNPTNQYNNTPKFDLHFDPFFDMRNRSLGGTALENSTIANPWNVIMENVPSPSGRYYPNNRFLTFSSRWDTDPESYGANSDPFSTGGDPYSVGARLDTNVMWYFFPSSKSHWIGDGCNQLGITDLFWNRNFNGGTPDRVTGNQQCYLNPWACVPGLLENTFGGRTIPGCLASTAFNNMIEYTDEQLTTTNPGAVNNINLIKDIAKQSMPPDYDPYNPNYWLADGNRLYYTPSQSAATFDLSFEVVIDLVGSFVGYADVFANGLILNSACQNLTGGPAVDNDPSNLIITVKNTGTINGSYILTFNCPPASGIVITGSTELHYEDLAPNATQNQTTTFTAPNISQLNQQPCELVLQPRTDVFAVLDTKLLACSIGLNPDNRPAPNDTDIPIPDPGDTKCGVCDFECFEVQGSITDSACFWVLVSTMGFFVFALIAAGITYCVFTSRRKDKSAQYLESIKKAEENAQLEEEQTLAQEAHLQGPPDKMDPQDYDNMLHSYNSIFAAPSTVAEDG